MCLQSHLHQQLHTHRYAQQACLPCSTHVQRLTHHAAALIFIVLLIMMFTVFTHSPKGLLGSPSQVGLLQAVAARPLAECCLTKTARLQVYDNLQTVSHLAPVSGNRGGSYLTFWSIDGELAPIMCLCSSPKPAAR